MTRLARIVAPGIPHHVTQRGNRQMPLFAQPDDYRLWLDLMVERCRQAGVVCWAWTLMPNHVHLILVPQTDDGLSRAVGETNRRFTNYINTRARTTGHLFQGRFTSAPMDETYLLNCVRYLAFNPVKAGLAARPEDWPWSSVRAHLAGRDDTLCTVRPLLDIVPRIADLFEPVPEATFAPFERVTAVARPLGSRDFVTGLEARLGRTLAPARRGPKPKPKAKPAG
jgi:putative transposase